MAGIIPVGISLLGSILGGISAHKKKKQAEKDQLAQQQSLYASGQKDWTNKEQTRVALLKQILANGNAHGANLQALDPSLLTERPYAGPQPVESHSGTAGDLTGFLGGLAGSAGSMMAGAQQQNKNKAELDRIQCLLDPRTCPKAPTMGPTDAELGYDPNAGLAGDEWSD